MIGFGSGAQAQARLQLLIAQAERGNCDLIAQLGPSSLVYTSGTFVDAGGARASLAWLRDHARVGGPVTFTAVPPGEGARSVVECTGAGGDRP
jgi:hypothetical protein